MLENLSILRDQIDKIDQDLLDLISKRFSLVSQVGEIKSHFGLFIYDAEREEMIISQRRTEAITLGISPDLIEDILRRIMRESYHNEHKKGFKKLCPNRRPIVIVGGKGQMGQFFFKMLTLSGYQVRILDQDDWEYIDSILEDVGVVFISVPIHLFKNIISRLPQLPSDCIMVDLSSVKRIPLKVILDVHNGPVLGLHPMFSPDNRNMVKQVIIYCEGRYPDSYRWLLKQIQLWGAKIYYCDSLSHDEYMSFIQGLCHFITFMMGYHLFQENIDLKKTLFFSSPKFYLDIIMVGRLFSQNPQLYADIIMDSKNNIDLIRRYYNRLGKILILLEQNNKQEFIDQFRNIKNWLYVYFNTFFEDSHKILNQVNDLKHKM